MHLGKIEHQSERGSQGLANQNSFRRGRARPNQKSLAKGLERTNQRKSHKGLSRVMTLVSAIDGQSIFFCISRLFTRVTPASIAFSELYRMVIKYTNDKNPNSSPRLAKVRHFWRLSS